MYIPKHFQLNDQELIDDMIKEYSFATLISQHDGAPFATHLPLLFNKDDQCLYGHFARANKQWQDITNQQVLVIFQGPHSYISPSWQSETNDVPTWNYISIHIYGTVDLIKDEETVKDILTSSVTKYENPNSGYHLRNLDPNYLRGMQKGIVTIKINITKMEAKAKLGQNDTIEQQKQIINGLENTLEENNQKVAELMKRVLGFS
ncbi:FMN-binding negative transcriptional regulator [Bacillus carboniphilus]|uniref:FMN-binding negative transcriptional regulator n=1 Tax=Bacillus carboniphilus TaxID=86663 RepID=A0ABY9JS96_9BACI|nr:FMN-binding negative transcriptional regulator [Bacillus carboniphilus]WLR42276.1 FMN-binding negative transcriptional regulator [Bacillus carboniphilus]